jgi:nucleoside-diphosphate-sugar epimerase
MNVLVTGATGFVGRVICARLHTEGMNVRGTLLSSETPSALVSGVEPVVIEPLGPATRWETALSGIDTVIHLAARVHIMRESAADPLREFLTVNTEATSHLARKASASGVRRIVFMSTIGVNGDDSGSTPYREDDEPHPQNNYSFSKYEAEKQLWRLASETGLEVVVIRAPFVYGQNNPGNFLSLLRVVSTGIPLPLASVDNKNSLIYVGNLADALWVCASHPDAAGNTYLVSDGEEVSTPELIRRTANALGVKARLFHLPEVLIRKLGVITGKTPAVGRLLGTLTVNTSKIRNELGWTPPFSMDEGLRDTAKWFNNMISQKRSGET